MSVPTEEVLQHLDFAPEPAVDPLLSEGDPDDLDFIPEDPAELRRAVTRMAAHINLADWRFVKLIAAMDRTGGWREGGYCNLGNWLDHRCGLGPCASRERIRIGRALAKLPRIDAAFRDGAISYSKVRAITRVATPHTEAMLLAIAEGSSAARLESLVRTYERVGGSVRGRDSSERRRGLSWYYEDGMLVLTAAVPAERGALVIEALQQVIDGRKDESEARCASLLGVTYPGETAAGEGSDGAAAEGAGAIHGEGAPAEAECTAVGVSTVVSAQTPEHRANGNGGAVVSARAASAAVTDMDVPEGVSAEASEDHVGGDSGKVVSTQIASADVTDVTDVDGAGEVSAETPADHAGEDSGEAVSARVAGAAVTDMDVSGDVSAETDDLPDWLTFELSSREQRFADALVDMAEHCLATPAGRWKRRRTGRRYEVVLTIDRNELAAKQSAGGARYHVEPDWGIDEEDARQIACDADLTEFIEDARGNLLNYERRRRIVPARLLRALKLRDQSRCRFPGCAHQRYVEAHHVKHWIDGGETCLENLVLLCGAHHRLLHHGAFHIVIEDGGVVFVSRDGEVIAPALKPQFAEVPEDVSAETDTVNCPLPTRRRRPSVFKTHSEREIIDMLHFREDWGRNSRWLERILKRTPEYPRTIQRV